MLFIFLFIFMFIFSIDIIGTKIWGIVGAVKTKDVEIKAGRLMLHLFLWGGLIAAIVYAIQAKK